MMQLHSVGAPACLNRGFSWCNSVGSKCSLADAIVHCTHRCSNNRIIHTCLSLILNAIDNTNYWGTYVYKVTRWWTQFHFINAQQSGFGLIMLHACTHGMYAGYNHIRHIQWHVTSLFMNSLLTAVTTECWSWTNCILLSTSTNKR